VKDRKLTEIWDFVQRGSYVGEGRRIALLGCKEIEFKKGTSGPPRGVKQVLRQNCGRGEVREKKTGCLFMY